MDIEGATVESCEEPRWTGEIGERLLAAVDEFLAGRGGQAVAAASIFIVGS